MSDRAKIKNMLQTLQRRAEMLGRRLSDEPNRTGRSYDAAERAALKWAIAELAAMYELYELLEKV